MKSLYRRLLLLSIPLLCGFLLFYVVPFFSVLRYALIESPFKPYFVGLKNFIDVCSNKYFRLAMKNTALFTIVAVPLVTLLSLMLAIAFTECTRPFGGLIRLMILPLLMPSAGILSGFRALPIMNRILTEFPVLAEHLLFLWRNLGFFTILITGGISVLPKDCYEAARLDGVTFLQKHIYVTLPGILPMLSFAATLSAVYSMRIFREVYLLYGSYPVNGVYLVQHYMNNHYMKLNFHTIAAAALIFAVIVGMISCLGFLLSKRAEEAL